MTRRRALVSSAVVLLALIASAIAVASGSSPAPTPVSLASGIAYTQDFDSLATSGTSNALPAGWQIDESGTAAAADGLYAAGDGSGNSGNAYSFGTGTSTDRALGTLLSGTNTPTIGATFTNATGATITALDVAYTGEQWRLGQSGRGADRLDFQYSLDATSATAGTWVDVDALDFASPVATGTVGKLDGNASGDRTAVAATISGLSIPPNATFWIRWSDFNVSGSDDGLGVDDLSLTPQTSVVTNQPPTVTCGGTVTTTAGNAASQQLSANDADGTIASIALDSVTPASSAITVSGFTPGSPATATLNVGADAAAGTYTVVVRATNGDSPPQSATCSLTVTVNPAPTVLPIGTVQGSVPDTGDPTAFDSPYVGQTVTVDGVVTELTHEGTAYGFYLQNTAATADADPATSDGIFVFMSTHTDTVNHYTPVVGDEIRATGKVSEFFDQTELGSVSATKVGTGTVTPFVADPPADPTDAARYWERHEGMFAAVPAQSIVDSPTHFYSSTSDTEFYALNPASAAAARANPYAQRVFRDAHPLGGDSGNLILITDEGIKMADPNARLTPVHTFQRLTADVTGGVYYDFGKYSVSASAEPQAGGGVDPYANGAPQTFDRTQGYSIANFNMENLYDYRDDPTDGCDFDGNAGCPGVTPPFDYTPASDAVYQARETSIANQIVNDLHAPDVIVVQEAEDQDVCSVANGAMDCGSALNKPDGKPDVLEELALHVRAAGGPAYDTAFDRNGADDRGIICAFMFRGDRVSLLPADASDPVLGSSPQIDYRGTPLSYDSDVSDPKALNAVLPADVDVSTGQDGTNVFTRAVQVAHFRVAPANGAAGTASDIWVAANHFTSNPDASVGQRQEQAAYNAAVVKAIQSRDPNAKVMVAGDLNVYPRPDSDQLHALYDAGLHDLYDTVLAQNQASAYSYSFTGLAQDLDHQFVTPSFFADLQAVHEAHINSDWTAGAFPNRGTSDHDPMVSQWQLKVDNPPVVHAGGPYTVDEGVTATLHASADDADGDAVSYAWDLDGNGTFETPGQTATLPAGDGPATLNVAVQATDSFGVSSTDATTVTVVNVAPTAQFAATGTVTAGGSVSLALSNPADPSAADTAAGFLYAFDCGSGYGAFSTASTATCPAPARGTLHVGGEIQDKDGGVREYRSDVTVNGRSPVVSAGGPYAVDEGGTTTLTATGSDPDGDSIAYAWDLDGNGSYETAGQSVAFHAGDGPATVTVSVRATDSTGATATSSATVTIRNVAPTATFHAPAAATVGVPFTISLTAPHDYDTQLQYAFDCGDGSGFGPLGSAASASCTATSGGTLTVRGEIADKDGGATVYTATVKVGVTFDGVCAVAEALARTPGDAKAVCKDLARAEDAAAKHHVVQETAALVAAAADVAKGVLRGVWTPREGAELVKLITRL